MQFSIKYKYKHIQVQSTCNMYERKKGDSFIYLKKKTKIVCIAHIHRFIVAFTILLHILRSIFVLIFFDSMGTKKIIIIREIA